MIFKEKHEEINLGMDEPNFELLLRIIDGKIKKNHHSGKLTTIPFYVIYIMHIFFVLG